MADRAEIKVVVDTREAKAEVKRTEDALKKTERRRVELAARADRVVRQARRAAPSGRAGGVGGAAAFAAGVLGARVGAPRLPTGGAFGKARRAAPGFIALALGVSAQAAEVAQVGIEVLRPVVDRILAETLPKFLPDFFASVIRDAITEDVNRAADKLKSLARLDTLKAKIARTNFLPIAGAFAFAGDAFSIDEINNLSVQFERASLRKSFLERQEARRTTIGLARTFADELLGE